MDLPKILWINGPAGYGKTILCSKIVQLASTATKGQVAYFFMSAETGEPMRGLFTIVRSWLSQLVFHNKTACKVALNHLESAMSPTVSDEEVVKVLKDVLRNVNGCILIADGLDECAHPGERDKMTLEFFGTIAEVTARTKTRVLLTSRSEADLQHAFSARLVGNAQVSVTSYSITPEDVHDDAAVLSKHVVDEKLENKSPDQRQELAEKIVTRSQGMFLWIKMMEADLNPVKNQKRLLMMVEGTPHKIDQVYARNWKRIEDSNPEDRKRAFSILRWTAFTPRPLTVLELTEALTIPEDETDTGELDEDDLPDTIDELGVYRGIEDICASLIEVRRKKDLGELDSELADATVHLRHFSVREYLAKQLFFLNSLCSIKERLPISHEDKRLPVSHELLQRRYLMFLCFRYLGVKEVWEEGLLLGKSRVPRVLIPLAVSFFSVLAEQPDVPPLISQAVNKLLDPRSTIWSSLSPRAWEFLQSAGVAPGIGFLTRWGKWPLDDQGSTMLAGSAICFAAWIGSCALEYLLTEVGVPATAETSNGWTSLHIACARPSGDDSLVNMLINHGADVNAKTKETGVTPLLVASRMGHLELVRKLLQSGAKQIAATDNNCTPLHVSTFRNRVEVAQFLVNEGADINAKNSSHMTPLHSACSYASQDIVSFLLDHGANIEAKTLGGTTPLHLASGQGHLECLMFLIQHDAEIMARDDIQRTIAHYAAAHGHLECLKFLIHQGADIIARTNHNSTPAHLAAGNGHLECVKFLIEQGTDIMARDNGGLTQTHLAAESGHLKCLEFLIQQGGDIIARTQYNLTPAHLAAGNGHVDCLRLLIEKGADPGLKDSGGDDVLANAIMAGQVNSVEFLLKERGLDTTNLYSSGRNLLGVGVISGSEALVDKLLGEDGLSALHRDNYGMTPIAIAVVGGNEAMAVKLISSTEGNFDLPDQLGRSLLWWTRRTGNDGLTETLGREALKRGVSLLEPAESSAWKGEDERQGQQLRQYYCDICTGWFRVEDFIYRCGVCNDGDFDICQECFELGGRCLGDYHVLNQKSVTQ